MKISIVGTGMIATEVIKMLRTEAKGIEITSLFTHSNKEKAQALAKTNHIHSCSEKTVPTLSTSP